MTGSGLMDFLISIVGLGIVIGLFFYAIDFIAPDERFKKIARLAVGGVALLMFLLAVKGVFFGGGAGTIAVTPAGLIEFAISLVVILVVLYIIYLLIDWLLPDAPAPGPFKGPVKYVIGAIALIVLLGVAGHVLTGGSLGLWPHGRRTGLLDSLGMLLA